MRIKEIWKPISGYKNIYSISSFGRIRSERKDSSRTWIGRILKPQKQHRGYLDVSLSKNKIKKRFLIHRIVSQAFIGNEPNNCHVNHKDTNKKNNNYKNLEYMTPKQNSQHALKNGLLKPNIMKGIKNPNSKLNDKKVIIIRNLYKNKKLNHYQLAFKFKVNHQVIWSVIHKKTWRHI